jgi:lipoic acid synthetase
VRVADNASFREVRRMVDDLSLHTVCQEAECPNIWECWARERTATFMLLGDVCTRHCGFCAVTKGNPRRVDPDEPGRVAEAVARLGLAHAVVTSVNRDDLPDGGARHFAETTRAIRKAVPGCRVELLVPDFRGSREALELLLDSPPDVLNHNLETVERLYHRVRPDARYREWSLELLRRAAERGEERGLPMRTKSGLMVGLGESFEELLAAFRDLREAKVDILTVGQYLQPHARRLPIEKYWTPEEFERLACAARELGFPVVEAGPLVRSSYHAGSAARRAENGDAAR